MSPPPRSVPPARRAAVATIALRPGWLSPGRQALLALLGAAMAPAPAHESTVQRFERSLDPRETLALAQATTLRDLPLSESATRRADECRLTLTLLDAETGREVPGLVRVTNAKGQALPLPALISRGIKLRTNHPGKDWHVQTGAAVLALPPELLRVEAFSGLETEQAIAMVDLRGKRSHAQVIPLRRFHAPARTGWYGGNTHLHVRGLSLAQADEYLRTLPRGDGLDLVFVSYLDRAGADQDYISNAYTRETLAALSSPSLRFGNGEEHRHNYGAGGEGYGHVLFLNLPELVRPVSIGAGIAGAGPDHPPLRRGIDRARDLGATIVWCHNAFGFEHAPNWLSDRVHAHNIFDGGTLGSYAYTYYRLLNLGVKVPFSTGTDWFLYDFSRVYVRLEDEPLNVENWLRSLAAGRTFITNGPFLELQANGHTIGETLSLAAPGRVTVRARAMGRSPFQELELVHNGRTVHRVRSRAAGGHFVAEFEHALEVESSGWVAARISGGALDTDGDMALPPQVTYRPAGSAGRNELGETLFAHTSAIYFDVAGRPLFDRAAAAAMIESMEASLRTIGAKSRFENDAQRAEVTGIYRDAIEELRRRLQP